MATREVKEREARGEDLTGIVWTAEKPFMMVRSSEEGTRISFFTCRADFDYAAEKARKHGEVIEYAANVLCFQKIDGFKSGFGRNTETTHEAYRPTPPPEEE